MNQIDIQEIKKIQARINEINAIPFDEIEWTDGSMAINVSPEVINYWKLTGLTNREFITSNFYKSMAVKQQVPTNDQPNPS